MNLYREKKKNKIKQYTLLVLWLVWIWMGWKKQIASRWRAGGSVEAWAALYNYFITAVDW